MHLTKIAIMLAQLGVSGIYFDALLKREERTIKRDSKIDLEVSIEQQVGATHTCSIHWLTNTYRIINSASFIFFSQRDLLLPLQLHHLLQDPLQNSPSTVITNTELCMVCRV